MLWRSRQQEELLSALALRGFCNCRSISWVGEWSPGMSGPVWELDVCRADEYREEIPTLARRRKASCCPQLMHFPLAVVSCGAWAGLF